VLRFHELFLKIGAEPRYKIFEQYKENRQKSLADPEKLSPTEIQGNLSRFSATPKPKAYLTSLTAPTSPKINPN